MGHKKNMSYVEKTTSNIEKNHIGPFLHICNTQKCNDLRCDPLFCFLL